MRTTWANSTASFSQIPWNYLKPGLGEATLILVAIGLIMGIVLLKRFPLTLILWIGLMYFVANLGMFELPGAGFVNPVSMEITLFLPLAILAGFAIGGVLALVDKFIPEQWQIMPRILITIIGAWSAFMGVQRLLPTLNPITFLAREADLPAIRWIHENIPEGEIILINPTGWGYGLYMGNDGGYWLSPLAGHQTLPPPVLYGLGEQANIEHTTQVIERVLSVGENAADLWELMQLQNIHYVYSGVRGGAISPKALAESDLFAILYQQDGTWVFETLRKTP